jgi:hypothetical protein
MGWCRSYSWGAAGATGTDGGVDYTLASDQLTFAPGVTSQSRV